MFKFNQLISCVILFKTFEAALTIATGNIESVNKEFRYCLTRSVHPSVRECVGRTAISMLQRFEEKENFTLVDDLIATRDDALAPRSFVNFLDTDPVDFRGILENAGAVISQRALEFHMDAIYPGLMFKIGPSAESDSVAEFVLDPSVDQRNVNYEEKSTARILTRHYILPFLLGLKFNLVALVPILFAIICVLLKKALFIAKISIYISSILGVGGIAGALGKFAGLKAFLSGYGLGPGVNVGVGVGGIPPPPPPPPPLAPFTAQQIGPAVGLYPGKNTVYSQYDPDDLKYISPYKRQDRKVLFEKTRGDAELSSINSYNKNILRSTVEPFLSIPTADHFYEYEKQILTPDHSSKPRMANINLPANEYEDNNVERAGVPSGHNFQTSDNSGWKAIN